MAERARRAFAAAFLAATAACGSYAASEPSTPEHGPLDDGGADADSGAVTLVVEGFADGTWRMGSVTITPTTTAHTGGHACRICYATGSPAYAQRTAGAHGPGLYHFSAWMKQESPDAANAATQLYLVYGGGQDVQFDPAPLDGTWRSFESSKRSTNPIADTGQWIHIDPSRGSCVLVDDVLVTWEP